MRITVESASVGDGPGAELPLTDFEFAPERPAVVAVDTDQRPTVLSLVVGGRMRPTRGRVLADGVDDAELLRTRIALVDTPLVAEPAADLRTGFVVREELAFANLRATPARVRAALEAAGAAEFAATPVRLLPGDLRTRLFAETAALRPGVEALVLSSPERHGADPDDLARLVRELGERGLAVLVITSPAMADALSERLQP